MKTLEITPEVLLDMPSSNIKIESEEARLIYHLFPDPSQYWDIEDDNEFDRMANEINEMGRLIAENPTVWDRFGFSATEEVSGTMVVTAPTVDTLNARRTQYIGSTGIHSGVFIEHPTPEVTIPADEYADYFANRQIPVSRWTHDYLVHNPTLATLSEDVFSTFCTAFQLAEGDETKTNRIVRALDDLTAGVGLFGTSKLVAKINIGYYYGTFMSLMAAGILAARDTASQVDTANKLLEL